MDLLLMLLTVLVALVWIRATKIPALLPISLFAVALFNYALGYIGLLAIAPWSVLIISAISMLFLVVRKRRALLDALKPKEFLNPANVIYLSTFFVSYLFTRGLQFHSWDEFSHWGFVTKATYLFDALSPVNPAQIQFRSYPPAVTLFEYFVSKIGFSWNEANVFWAYQLLIAALLYPFLAKLKWRNKTPLAIAFAAGFLAPLAFFNSYTEIYIDSILGLTFGFTVAVIYISDLKKWATSVQLAISLAFLVLIKDSGAYFAAIATIYFLIKLFVSTRGKGSEFGLIKKLAMAIIPAASALVAYLSWSWLLSSHGVEKIFNQPIEISKIFSNGSSSPQYWNEVRSNFATAFFSTPLNGFISQVFCFIILIGFLFVFERISSRAFGDKFSFSLPVTMTAGAVIYTVGLLALYLFRFGEYEAVRLASFGRYLGTYWAAVVFILTALSIWLVSEKSDFSSKNKMASKLAIKVTSFSSVWLIALLVIVGGTGAYPAIANAASDSTAVRAPLEPLVQKADTAGVTKGSKVWIISQYSNGFEYWILRYGLLEATVNDGGWSLGTKNGDQDVWTAPKTAQEWSQDLRTYDFVVFYNVTQQFYDEFNSVFETPADLNVNTVFRVVDGESGAKLVLAK